MNYAADRSTIAPLRPDPGALARAALQSVARAAIHAGRNAGKYHLEKNPWPNDRSLDWLTRAPTSPTKISDAPALMQLAVSFLKSLVPVSASAAVLDQVISLSLDGVSSVSCPGITLPAAAWVSEAAPIPVGQGVTSAGVTMSPNKLALIVPLTREMIEGSNAEPIMRQVLLENVGGSLDLALFSNAAGVPGLSPPGLLNGVAALTATAAGANAMVEDLGNLAQALAPVAGNADVLIVAAIKQAAVLRMALFNPTNIYASNALPAGRVIAIAPAAIVAAIGAPEVTASIDTTLIMANPAADVVSAGSPSVTGAPSRSLFQTDTLGLRFRLDASWAKRGAGVAWVDAVNW
jgi:Phage capsid family